MRRLKKSTHGDLVLEEVWAYEEAERDEYAKRLLNGGGGDGNVVIQPYKGPGETNPDHLWKTTMDCRGPADVPDRSRWNHPLEHNSLRDARPVILKESEEEPSTYKRSILTEFIIL